MDKTPPLKMDTQLEKMTNEISLENARRALFYLLEKADLSECEPDKKSETYLTVFHLCEILKKE